MNIREFYKGKKVFVTGHTGFKGSWLCEMLVYLGANVVGYALEPNTSPALFNIAKIDQKVKSIIGDIRDLQHLKKVFNEEKPEIVFHLAAQPIVLESYKNPVYTYETNVMGTVNLMECIRLTSSVKSVINVTTDKVYQNNEWCYGYRENDRLNGYDPYSNSKSCSELVTSSYKNAFLNNLNVAVSTCRAGNVIGGGDFSPNRIIPDCVRAMKDKKDIEVRNPNSIRPYQHVLEPLYAYLMIAEMQYENHAYIGEYNIGPNESDCITTGELATIFCNYWKDNAKWHAINNNGPHEAKFLKLDCSKIKSTFNWQPRWNVNTAIFKTIEWSKEYLNNKDIKDVMIQQIDEFLSLSEDK